MPILSRMGGGRTGLALCLLAAAAVVAGCSFPRVDEPPVRSGKALYTGAVRQKFEIPSPGAVQPRGWIRDVAIAQRNGHTARMDEIDAHFRRAWREDTRPRGKDMAWNANPGAWSCEGGAYWFDGLIRLAYQLDDEELKVLASNRLETVLSKMSEDAIGFCWWLDRANGAHVEELRDSRCWLVWVTGLFARPVCAWFEATHDRRAASALANAFGNGIFDYPSYATTPSGAYAAYRLTGDERIGAALDRFFGKLARRPGEMPRVFSQYAAEPGKWLDETLSIKRRHQNAIGMPTRHGVIASEALLSMLCGYLWTGNTNWLAAVRGWYGFFDGHMRQPYGVTTMDEEWGYPGPARGTETCVVAAESWTRINILAALGEGKWGDDVERAFFNAGQNCATADFRRHVYMQQPNRVVANDLSDCSFSGGPGEELGRYRTKHWPLCCTAALNRILPDFVQAMWMISHDNGVAATLYGPSSVAVDLRRGRFEAEEITDYPFADSIKIRIKSAPDGDMAFRLRLPAWCEHVDIRLNGKPVKFEAECGFAKIVRKWRAGDVLDMHLPMRPEIGTLRDYVIPGKTYRYVSMGPLLFAKNLTGSDVNTPVEDVSMPVLAADAADRMSVMRSALKPDWNWKTETSPIQIVVPDVHGKNMDLVPYGCAKMRISLFE